MNSKEQWIKVDELPEDFWQECFVSIYDGISIFTEINYIKKVGKNVFWYSETEREWFSFRNDIGVRVMVIGYPKVTEEDFK